MVPKYKKVKASEVKMMMKNLSSLRINQATWLKYDKVHQRPLHKWLWEAVRHLNSISEP